VTVKPLGFADDFPFTPALADGRTDPAPVITLREIDAPVERRNYNTGETNLLGAVLRAAIGNNRRPTWSTRSGAPSAWSTTPTGCCCRRASMCRTRTPSQYSFASRRRCPAMRATGAPPNWLPRSVPSSQ
jgi:hypothetical protein